MGVSASLAERRRGNQREGERYFAGLIPFTGSTSSCQCELARAGLQQQSVLLLLLYRRVTRAPVGAAAARERVAEVSWSLYCSSLDQTPLRKRERDLDKRETEIEEGERLRGGVFCSQLGPPPIALVRPPGGSVRGRGLRGEMQWEGTILGVGVACDRRGEGTGRHGRG